MLAAVAAACAVVLLAWSQTHAFAWDEGFHLLAAQLIAGGKRPYLDFCFPQVPGNALWNALWIRALSLSWRGLHAVAALVTLGTVLLAARSTRGQVSLATALFVGLNATVIEYATTGQPYALCLFFLVAAYCASVRSRTVAAGLLASAAIASSLLVAAAPVVLLAWTLFHARPGERIRKLGAFLAGAAVPMLPILWLAWRAPRIVFFNLFEYQLVYRRANWEDASQHDWVVLKSGLTSPGALLLIVFAALGLWFCRTREIRLSGWLALAIGAELAAAHPTFEWYFVLVIPFLAIPAAAGWCKLAPRPGSIAVLALLLAATAAKPLLHERHGMAWPDLEAVAQEVNQVAPPPATIWADEAVYFLTRRPPAPGTEFAYTEVIDLPAPQAASLHIVPLEDLDRQAASGRFAAVSTCEEADQIEALDLPRIFQHSAAVGECHVFWAPSGKVP